MKYNWQLPDWPNFNYDDSVIDGIVLSFALETGEMKGLLDALPDAVRQETILEFMMAEAIKTSEIEGEFFSRQDIMSSLKKQLGIGGNLGHIKDRRSNGVAELMVAVGTSYQRDFTESLLKRWHKILMKDYNHVSAGSYRKGEEPMQIVSGAVGREVVHFLAPDSGQVSREMKVFVKWYNEFRVNKDDIKRIFIKTAIAHLYFETIHPFEDGNGRIGRAIAEKCLSESLGRPVLIGLSSTIEKERTKYYNALKAAQRTLEITEWIQYFSEVILESQKSAKRIVLFTLNKVKFLDKHKPELNERAFKAILKMFDMGTTGFEGGMTAKKYLSINKTSRATATRDLQDLVSKKVLIQEGEGRSVRYLLNIN
ncbi:Fic family protein [Niabella insulamsoli]|uniref:Fic family protein n=1 Tax=Niabella insulamsoli TaxID=3144874 RepID=UPI0031FE1A78